MADRRGQRRPSPIRLGRLRGLPGCQESLYTTALFISF
jgi:hypothetical protein